MQINLQDGCTRLEEALIPQLTLFHFDGATAPGSRDPSGAHLINGGHDIPCVGGRHGLQRNAVLTAHWHFANLQARRGGRGGQRATCFLCLLGE